LKNTIVDYITSVYNAGDFGAYAAHGGMHLVNTALGNYTFLLLNNPTINKEVVIVKTTSDANTITITVDGGGTINGNPSLVLSAAYEKVQLYPAGSNWVIIG
jgi:hypothetical protein